MVYVAGLSAVIALNQTHDTAERTDATCSWAVPGHLVQKRLQLESALSHSQSSWPSTGTK